VVFVWARRGRGPPPGLMDEVLGIAVAVTTVASGLTYLLRWARILARSEQVL
jgi:hypothetical protein